MDRHIRIRNHQHLLRLAKQPPFVCELCQDAAGLLVLHSVKVLAVVSVLRSGGTIKHTIDRALATLERRAMKADSG